MLSTDDWESLKSRPAVVGLKARGLTDPLVKMLSLKPEERVLAEAVMRHE